jgi:phosphomannomutase
MADQSADQAADQTAGLLDTARAWLAVDPDEDTRCELSALVTSAEAGDAAPLAERFAGRLQFGTAGLRGELGAGPMRMNRVTVRRATAGLVRYLLDHEPGSAERGIVIGYDARHKSDAFARDAAAVAAGLGMKAMLMPGPGPTPVLAWSVPYLRAVAGVTITASHNPPRDNGYKVYLEDGSQIVSPIDVDIAAAIDAVDPAGIELAPAGHPLVVDLDASPVDAYLDAVPSVRLVPKLDDALDRVSVAYTPMHGVGGDTLLAAFERAGWPRPTIVAAQFTPDPDFPTVSFPNPEEPGAMDLLLACAREAGADLALANDPDADRLGAAIPTPDGGWRRLTGDELGWLLADHILRHTTGDDRLVVTTLVSSSLLGHMAAAAGVQHAETFTGFKWIAKTVRERPDERFVFGYEQALGYLVTALPRDKDGITAAVLMAEVAALAKAEGVTLQERLDDLAERFGRYVTAERSLRMEPAVAAARVTILRSSPPAAVAGRPVDEVLEYPEANLLRLVCGRSRVQVRPSGTEPKVKIYGEGVDEDPQPLIDAVADLLLA